MLNTNKQNLAEKFDFLFSANIQNAEISFPSIYSREDVIKMLRAIQDNARNIIEALAEVEETPTEEQKYTLKEVQEAIHTLDFDNSDFCTLETDEYGSEVRVTAQTCEHELADYVETEILEYLNNIER